ncbi:MAG: restriction endonuclease subunit S, partial [Fusobacteriaceae bacterium]
MEELKEGWKKVKLENLTNYIARGITPKYSENINDMIVINQKCIRNGKLSLKNSRYHNYSLKNVSDDKILKKYDILINSTGVGTLGRVCQNLFNNKNLTVDTHVTIVRPNFEKINPIYLGFSIRNNQNFIESLGEGSTGQTELKRQRLAEEVEIFYPENTENQEKIASILSSLDDKIELNNEMNKTLEEMAQTLFKRWFIDFEFPNENGEPYKTSGGKMIDSELGEIPDGWEVLSLETRTNQIVRGITPKYDENSNIKVLNQKVNKGNNLEKQYFKFLKKEIEVPKDKYAQKWDVLLNS